MSAKRKHKQKRLKHVKEVNKTCKKARKVWAEHQTPPAGKIAPEPIFLCTSTPLQPPQVVDSKKKFLKLFSKAGAAATALTLATFGQLFMLALTVLHLRLQYDTADLMADIIGGIRVTAVVTFLWVPVMSAISFAGGFVWWLMTQMFFEVLPVNLFLSLTN